MGRGWGWGGGGGAKGEGGRGHFIHLAISCTTTCLALKRCRTTRNAVRVTSTGSAQQDQCNQSSGRGYIRNLSFFFSEFHMSLHWSTPPTFSASGITRL